MARLCSPCGPLIQVVAPSVNAVQLSALRHTNKPFTVGCWTSPLGWGAASVEQLSAGVISLDSFEWAEAEPRGAEYPACHFTCGMLAEFFTRLGDGTVAVMEVECRCRGDARCRFLLASPEVLTWLYDQVLKGTPYAQALTGIEKG